MKKILFIVCLTLMSTLMQYSEAKNVRNKEEEKIAQQNALKEQAQEYATLLEKGDWMVIPNRANFPKTITFLDMREDINYFRKVGDTLDIRLDLMGARVSHALTDEQVLWLIQDNAELGNMLQYAPPFYKADCTVKSKEVKISKNNKYVTLELRCQINNTNFRDFNSIPYFTIRIDVKAGTAQVTCSGMHYNESYDGPIYQVQTVSE